MRVVLVYNPRSGRGLARGASRAFADGLSGLGHEVTVLEAGGGEDLRAAAHDADALVIAGGDGTLHHAVVELIDTTTDVEPGATPGLYHLPLGTQNLFARELGMTADPHHLHRLMTTGRPRALDVGLCNGRAFLLMCSVGPDSGVLARLHAAASENGRRRPITHRSYILPMLREWWSLNMPVLNITIDGTAAVSERAGMVVIGNSRRYAMRFNPAVRASMSDGVLDAVFLPARGRAAMLGWALLTRLGWHTGFRSMVYRTGRQIEVSNGGKPTAFQLDGELFESADGRLAVSVLPGALRVWA